MNHFAVSLFLGVLVLAGVFAWSSNGAVGDFVVQNGRVLVDGQLVQEGIDILQTRFNFLFVYVPDSGLWTISNREFEGAVLGGGFDGPTLQTNVAGHDFRLETEGDILPAEPQSAAWVKLDADFRLDVAAPMIGYGDEAGQPYRWEHHVNSNR